MPCEALHREEVTADLIAQHGYTLIHPFDNDHIIAGQGTAALELFDEVGPLDFLFVPVGGGGLISGSALAAALRSPSCRVIGVEPERGADAGQSWRAGQVVKLDAVPDTLADGLRTRAIGRRNLAIMRRFVADMTAVSEDDIRAALEFLWGRMKIVVEPSAAVALAPLLLGRYPILPGARVGVLLSGGNVDVTTLGFLAQTHLKEQAVEAPLPTAEAAPAANKSSRPARILLCAPVEDSALTLLQAAGQVDTLAEASEETLINCIGDYHALLVGPNQRVNSHIIKYGYTLRAIGSLAGHLDNINVSTARAMGIEVCYAPDSRAVAIAEHTFGRLLSLAESFADGHLAGKTLGLIGYGLIGRQVAHRARPSTCASSSTSHA